MYLCVCLFLQRILGRVLSQHIIRYRNMAARLCLPPSNCFSVEQLYFSVTMNCGFIAIIVEKKKNCIAPPSLEFNKKKKKSL